MTNKELTGLLAGFKELTKTGKTNGKVWEKRKYSFMFGEKSLTFLSWKNFDHLIGKQVTLSFTEEQKQKDGSPYIQKTIVSMVEAEENTLDGMPLEAKDGEEIVEPEPINIPISEFRPANSKEIVEITLHKGQCFNIAGKIVANNTKTRTLQDEDIIKMIFELAEKLYQEGKKSNWVNRL